MMHNVISVDPCDHEERHKRKNSHELPKDDTVRVYPSLSEGKGMGNLMRMFNKLIDVKNGHNMRESLVVIPFSSFPLQTGRDCGYLMNILRRGSSMHSVRESAIKEREILQDVAASDRPDRNHRLFNKHKSHLVQVGCIFLDPPYRCPYVGNRKRTSDFYVFTFVEVIVRIYAHA